VPVVKGKTLMVSIVENKSIWDRDYPWSEAGDEWSAAWGSSAMQWHGTLMPRIHRCLPADTVLEIACGHGRWTQYLLRHCQRLIGIDLSSQCIGACKQRFAGQSHASFFQNDGKSLAMVDDASVDFIFSFDSLVHADFEVLDGYLSQFARVLRRDGVAFIHHSNNGECWRLHPRRIPKLRGALRALGILEFHHLRDLSVSATKVERLARTQGLACVSQEITTWLTNRTFIDCFSMIVRADSTQVRPNRVIRNAEFAGEAQSCFRLASLYE
jgi:ubiquinone/menaquinone biosynthesis C-methylase UbiE